MYYFQFQNISCYCLTGKAKRIEVEEEEISKHLMLLFNLLVPSHHLRQRLFQNISCYCLTNQEAGGRGGKRNFKTSHVIV